jgi:zinc protease
LTLPEIHDDTLANGLRVVLVERPSLPLVSLELQLRGGASAHGTDQAGLAAFVADMLDEGTEGRTALDVAQEVEQLGATLNSSAGYDASWLHLGVLRSRLEPALELLADLVLRPVFPEDELERVRLERLARVVQRSDLPAAVADDAFAATLYGPDHPYGASLLGTAETLGVLTRDDLVGYHRARYAPGQATLIVAGDVSRDDLHGLLAVAFQGWEGQGEAIPPATPPPTSDPPGRQVLLVDMPGASQSELRIGTVGVSRSTERFHTLVVANTVLGGSFTSRLNTKLREEKGYTYGAGSVFDMRRGAGPFEASTAVESSATDSAVVDILEEIGRLSREPVPQDELARARNYLALRLPQRFESADDVVRALSALASYDVPFDFYEAYVEEVLAVDAASILEAARAALDVDDMHVVVVGDRAAVEEPLRALGLGPFRTAKAPGSR